MHSGETRLVAAIRQALRLLPTFGGPQKRGSHSRFIALMTCLAGRESQPDGSGRLYEDEIRSVEGLDAGRGGPEGTPAQGSRLAFAKRPITLL